VCRLVIARCVGLAWNQCPPPHRSPPPLTPPTTPPSPRAPPQRSPPLTPPR
jgi:hypothetical protein